MANRRQYQKIAETEQRAGYAYGFPERERYLIFDKVTGEVTVADEEFDPGTHSVIREILLRQQSENAWPAEGSVQS